MAALILYRREHDRQVRARGPIEWLPAADSAGAGAGELARRLGLAAEQAAGRPGGA